MHSNVRRRLLLNSAVHKNWQCQISKLLQREANPEIEIIIGSGENVNDINYHLFNVHPTVNEEAILKFLKPIFPEGTCLKLNCRCRDEYTSFKIGISQVNSDKFANAKLWSAGTKINKFFRNHRKATEKTQT